MAEIQQNQENPIFGRKEISLEVSKDEYGPTYANAIKILSEKFSVDQGALKINKVDVSFGSRTFKIFANIYNSPEERQKVEKQSKKEGEAVQKIEEERKAQEAPAEETQSEGEEQSQEENSEEAKSDESSGEEKSEEKTE